MLKRVNTTTITCPNEHHLPSAITTRYNRFHLNARSFRRPALFLGAGIIVFVGIVWGRSILAHRPLGTLRVSLQPARFIADGYAIATLHIEPQAGRPVAESPKVTVADGRRRVVVRDMRQAAGGWFARVRIGVQPGQIVLKV